MHKIMLQRKAQWTRSESYLRRQSIYYNVISQSYIWQETRCAVRMRTGVIGGSGNARPAPPVTAWLMITPYPCRWRHNLTSHNHHLSEYWFWYLMELTKQCTTCVRLRWLFINCACCIMFYNEDKKYLIRHFVFAISTYNCIHQYEHLTVTQYYGVT